MHVADRTRSGHGRCSCIDLNIGPGVVTLTAAARALAVGYCGLCRRCRLPPLLRRLDAELAECLPGNQVTLDVEGVVDGGMGGQKSLR